MGINFRDILAGLAAGAETEGALINRRKDADSASKRALAQLLAKPEAGSNIAIVTGEDEDGPGIFAVDKIKGTKTRIKNDGATPVAPSLSMPQPAVSADAPPSPARLPNLPPPVTASIPGNPSGDFDLSDPVTPKTPTPITPSPVAPQRTPTGLRPIAKAPVAPKAPARVLVRNEANQMVSVDPTTGLDLNGKPVKGYVPPQQPGLVPVQRPDGNGGVETILTPKVAGTVVPGPNTKTPAAIQTAVASNRAQLARIDDAERELDAHPTAVGLNRAAGDIVPFLGGVSDFYNQRADSAGVGTRASIANISSMVIKDRSGAAVTVSEFPRLAPFVPRVGDTPQAIKVKLQKLREGIEQETRLLEQGGGGTAASAKSPPPAAADPEFDALISKYSKRPPA